MGDGRSSLVNSLEDIYGQFSLIGSVKFDFLAEVWICFVNVLFLPL